jgi:hypothetical protein
MWVGVDAPRHEGDPMDDATPEQVDRRRLIKRAGLVTAGVAAWSTPMVTSLASSAAAAGSAPTPCRTCGLEEICGQNGNPVDGTCYCLNENGTDDCYCLGNEFCEDVSTCATTADCPPGFVCYGPNTGCSDIPVCLPLCENTRGARMGTTRSGPSAV